MNKVFEYKETRGLGGGHALIALFQILALAIVFLFNISELNMESLFFALGLIVFTGLSSYLVRVFRMGDPYFLPIVNMIFSIGIIMIYRINPALGQRQMFIYLISVTAFFLTYIFLKYTHEFWEGKIVFFFLATLSLFLVTLFFGRTRNGAQNWISIAGIQIQPSEFAKIPFAFFVASWFKNYEYYNTTILKKLSLTLATFVLIGLFFMQKELGTAAVFFAVLLILQIAYEKNKWIPFLNIIFACIGLILGYKLFGHVRVRFDIWLNPWKDALNKGYQIIQASFGMAEGSFFGTGIGLGHPEKIPLGHSDFIFAAVVEEFGALMGLCLIFLFIILLYRGFKAAMMQEKDFYSALSLCIVVIFAAQAFIMFAGTMQLIPLTGITIPFLTYGGSSLLSSFLLLSVLQLSSQDFIGWRD